ncbi:Pentatricopeptide repeat-containing protein At4g13650 [Linum perenne]
MSFCRFPTLSKAWKLAAGHLISRAPATACSVENPGCLSDPYFINKAVSFCAKSCSVSSAVVDMYAKYGDIWSAHKLFDELPERNTVTWNSLISGYLDADSPKLAVRLFVEMLREEATSVTPFTLSSCLVGCSQLEDRELGEQIHGVSLKSGFGYHVVVGTVLIDMYSKSCSIGESKLVFDRMVGKNVITWTSMVTAYSQNHRPYEAMVLAREMMECGLRLNSVTYNSLLSSFSSPDYLDCCKQVHCRVIREGFESNRYIAVTLVAVYSKCCNRVEEFVKLCSNVTIWDQVSWNALISGYCNLEREKEALRCFCEMRRVGIDGDFYTFTSLLGAIGNSSFLEEGREIHALVSKTGYASSLCIQNGVVSMYARCGSIEESKRMFRMMPEHDVVSWNSLMTACAHHGYGEEAVELFEEMMKKKSVMMINPDATTFLAVLSACSHAGVVDIFGRAGYLKEAAEFIRNMPVKPGPSVYKALLSACLVHGDLETAELSARKLLDLSPDDSAAYVMLFNMLKRSDHWNDAEALQRLICYRGLKKMPGYSWF